METHTLAEVVGAFARPVAFWSAIIALFAILSAAYDALQGRRSALRAAQRQYQQSSEGEPHTWPG